MQMVTLARPRERQGRLERTHEEGDVWVGDHPVTFDEYLHRYEGYKEHIELVRGVPTTRMAANIAHEGLFMWIARLLGDFVERRDLGVVLGSRTAVQITNYDGRVPDILFVRKERLGILEWLKLNGPPDLVIELISPGDRPSDRMKLEADYRSIGVPEIVFIDMKDRSVKTLRMTGSDYEVENDVEILRLECPPGFWIDVNWLFSESRPPVHEALLQIKAGP